MKIFLIVFMCIVCFESCKKDKEENNTGSNNNLGSDSHKLDSSLYPYLFDSGSYWIYIDSASSNIDSIALTNIDQTSFIIPPSQPNPPSLVNYEYFDAIYFRSNTSTSYHEQLFSNVISRSLYHGGFVFISGKRINEFDDNAKIIDVIDSINIENVVYRNVTKMKISQDAYINGNFYFYYADSVGIIKKDSLVNDTVVQTWNLLRRNTSLYNYH